MTNRRRFIESAAAGAAAIAIAPAAALADASRGHSAPVPGTPEATVWDITWTDRVKGKHRAVFDCTEVDEGAGVWRAGMWTRQAMEVLNVPRSDITPIVVVRHEAIELAMQQAFWDKYGVTATRLFSENRDPTKSVSGTAPAEKLSVSKEVPIVRKQLADGVIVLACGIAFQFVVSTIKDQDKVSDDDARARAMGYLIPGVILQPSGVFAVIRAQQAGAAYIKAS